MKQFAHNSSPLSLPPPAKEAANPPEEKRAGTLKDFFDGWLSSVSQTILQAKTLVGKPTRAFYGRRPLTSIDVVRVNRVTVRESSAHRHWPPEVVAKFLAATVIPRK